MGLKARFSSRDIHLMMNFKKKQLEEAILQRLEYIGWEFVRMARSKNAADGGFNDRTGNLRSSIGFVVLKKGVVQLENVEQTSNGAEGANEARKLLLEVSAEHSEGYALIVVAGMNYAAAVESKGKDVITGSSLEAEKMVKRAINVIKRRVASWA